jgi:hypothetical protein
MYGYNFLAQDADGDELTYTAVKLPDWLSFDVTLHTLSGTPLNEDVGIHEVNIRVSDGTDYVDHPFQITVINVNDPPQITSVPADSSVLPGEEYRYQITAEDVDVGDVLSFTATGLPSWLTLTPSASEALLAGTPSASDVGVHTLQIKVSDGTAEAGQEVSIEVEDPSGLPFYNTPVRRIYPVPAGETVFIEFDMAGEAVISIYDITGALRKEVIVNTRETVKLDISDLHTNLYFYKITVDDMSCVGKLIRK